MKACFFYISVSHETKFFYHKEKKLVLEQRNTHNLQKHKAFLCCILKIQVPKLKLDPLGIDPIKAEKLLGDIEPEDKPQIYVEEHVEYLPERRASQYLIAFDDKANRILLFMLIHFLNHRPNTYLHVQKTSFK